MTAEDNMVNPNRLRKRAPRKESKGFTIEEIKTLEPDTVPYYITDRDGFAVRVMPSGVKTFYYKYTLNRKKDQKWIGNFVEKEATGKPPKDGELTLKMARDEHAKLRTLVKRGEDPKGTARHEPAEGNPKKSYLTMTVHELADDYVKFLEEDHASGTSKEHKRTIERYVIPFFEDRKITHVAQVTRTDAIALIRGIGQRVKTSRKNAEIMAEAMAGGDPKKLDTTTGQARAVLKIARAMFNYQLEGENVHAVNPFAKLQKNPQIRRYIPTKKQARKLEDEEIVALWQTLNSSQGPGSASAARALLLTLITAQRPGEVTGMHRDQISGDWWQIPVAVIKTRNLRWEDHRIFLTPLAKKVIGDFQGYIFPSPSPSRKGKPISEKALTRLVNESLVTKKGVVSRPMWLGLPRKWTPNDLRKTARTHLTSLGCPVEPGEAILNHMKEEIHGKYDLYTYDHEKEKWLSEWAEKLERLIRQQSAEDIRLTDASYDVKELETLVEQMPLTDVAKKLGISDNAVRKRCKTHGIELKPRGHWLKGKPRGW